MCGIIGYIGDKQVLPILIDGLRRLDVALHDRTEDGGTSFVEHFWHSILPTANHHQQVMLT